ncbi:MAG: cytochrome C oxidase subunit I [Bacteroidetes bacterium]|nr:cytochrome C oxidase subunit I [Bacteroidota bacterium]
MFPVVANGLQQTTSYKVVLPFYLYAAIAFLFGSILLFSHSEIGQQHYFNPRTLAITHIMALGWGTMIIMGASHQLLPVLIGGKLYSTMLGYISLFFLGLGIPFLVVGFYTLDFGILSQIGAILINIGVLSFFINVLKSVSQKKELNIHGWYMATATIWLLITTGFGLLLVYNFSFNFLPSDSIHYLTLHAHFGIIGWFLMMVFGVGSRLIPMFLISKYQNLKILRLIFVLINCSLLLFIIIKTINLTYWFYGLPLLLIGCSLILYIRFCANAYKVRIRKNVDLQMKASLLSVGQLVLPLVIMFLIFIFFNVKRQTNWGTLYGFVIFFGWITAIIFGMTFKTLPFIVWNKVYHKKAHLGKTPAPKDLFSNQIFYSMMLAYLLGFFIFIFGIIFNNETLLKIGALAIIIAAMLYVINVMIVFLHKPLTK